MGVSRPPFAAVLSLLEPVLIDEVNPYDEHNVVLYLSEAGSRAVGLIGPGLQVKVGSTWHTADYVNADDTWAILRFAADISAAAEWRVTTAPTGWALGGRLLFPQSGEIVEAGGNAVLPDPDALDDL